MRIVCVIVAAGLCSFGCKKKSGESGDPGSAAGSGTAAATGSGSGSAGTSGSGSATPSNSGSGSGSAAAAPNAVPKIEGTPTKVTAVASGDHPFTITVPAGFKLEEVTDVGEEELPYATLAGPDVSLRLEQPEAGYFELEDEKKMTQRGFADVKFDLADAEPDGWSLVFKQNNGKYAATVQRKSLSLSCASYELTNLEHAMTAIAICRTIAAAK